MIKQNSHFHISIQLIKITSIFNFKFTVGSDVKMVLYLLPYSDKPAKFVYLLSCVAPFFTNF